MTDGHYREYHEDDNGLLYVQAHCDSKVCHAPGVCEYCDWYPEVQQRRIELGYNFTGESDPDKKPDPATAARPLSSINAWAGNIPENKDMPIAEKRKYARGQSMASLIMYNKFTEYLSNCRKPK